MKTPAKTSSRKSTPAASPAVDLRSGTCEIQCLLYGIPEDDSSFDRCLLSSGTIKRLGLRIGSCAIVSFSNSTCMLCNIWPNQRGTGSALPGEYVTICKVWAPNLEVQTSSSSNQVKSPGQNRSAHVKISSASNARTVAANNISCSIVKTKSSIDLCSSASFRALLRHCLQGCYISKGLSLAVIDHGSPVTIEVNSIVASLPAVDSSATGAEIQWFYSIDDSTIVTLESPSSPLQILPEAMVPDIHNHQQREVVLQVMVDRVSESFAGFEPTVRLAAGLACLGLGLVSYEQPLISEHQSKNIEALAKQVYQRPKGLLFCGPGGSGKSQLLNALVTALRCQVRHLDHSLLLYSRDGVAEAAMRGVFLAARDTAPCVIVMENMDLLCPSRSASTATPLQKRLTSCWLLLVDELPKGVIVLATTTKVMDLDPAVRRAGRIEREIELTVPTVKEREAILRLLFARCRVLIRGTLDRTDVKDGGGKSGDGISIAEALVKEAAATAHGTVGADLLVLVKETVLQATRRLSPQRQSTSTENNLADDVAALSLSSASANETSKANVVEAIAIEIQAQDVAQALKRVSPSALREVVVEVPTVRWSDIGGMEGVKKSLKQVVEWPLKHPDWFTALRIAPLKGVLLYGPPGCSKTLMAKAVATESAMNFLAVRGPELLSKWLGESEKAVQTLFRRARAAAPAIIFFDEIDALAGKRGSSSSGVSDRVLAQLLTELDGVQQLRQVVVIAATNRPDMLDPALIRPGRIDRKIYVPPPDEGSRRSILQLELGKMPVAVDVDVEALVQSTNGFSGAEVVAVVSEAAVSAVEQDSEELAMTHLEEAAGRIMPQITAEMLAFYESFDASKR